MIFKRPDESGFSQPPTRSGFFYRVLENPDNPLGWSLKLFTLRGITVRIHLFTVVYMLGQLLWSIPERNGGILFVAPAVAALFVLVLLHEFGHCIGCRWVGGEADRIVMLPWGGLALCQPPRTWKANLITSAAGPGVNLAIVPLTCLGLWAAGLKETILFDPFHPLATFAQIKGSSDLAAFAKVCLWWLHYVNLALLAFNLLLVMYPFDGGRIIQSLLWSRVGDQRATYASVMIGFFAAMVVCVLSLLIDKALLVTIAVFGGWACWMEFRRLRGEVDLTTGEFPIPPPQEEDAAALAARRTAQREQAQQEQRQQELDRILAKIKEKGIASLTRAERKTLDRESKSGG